MSVNVPNMGSFGAIPRSESPMEISTVFPELSDTETSDYRSHPYTAISGTSGLRSLPTYRPVRRYSQVGLHPRYDSNPPSRDPLSHPDLVHMANTLQRIANSDEIPPAEYWTSAGLDPIIAQGGSVSGIRLRSDLGNDSEPDSGI